MERVDAVAGMVSYWPVSHLNRDRARDRVLSFRVETRPNQLHSPLHLHSLLVLLL